MIDRDVIRSRVEKVMLAVFDVPVRVTDAMQAADVDGWDSITNLQLIAAIEAEFKTKFTLPEIIGLKNVGNLLDLIASKAR
jgi:acyl carrier protein